VRFPTKLAEWLSPVVTVVGIHQCGPFSFFFLASTLPFRNISESECPKSASPVIAQWFARIPLLQRDQHVNDIFLEFRPNSVATNQQTRRRN
jgi:hypothetical protein